MKMLKTKTVVCISALAATPAAANTLMVGPGQRYATPSAAAAAAHDGDTISIAAGIYNDCAVWSANNLTIAGAGMNKTTIGNKSCIGKGVFVIYGNNVKVRDLALVHASVPAQNGAGARLEGANPVLVRVRISFNQDGILADPIPKSTIRIRDSYFNGNGSCPPAASCTHGIYVLGGANLTVEHSTFRNQRVGHHIKSRAASTNVIDSTIEDGPTGTSSYLIDAPNGGKVTISGNYLEKGPLSSNPYVAISIGEEGVTWPAAPLLIENNVFRNDGRRTTFVNNTTSVPAQLIGNTMEGDPTAQLHGPGKVN